ncbi:hypothetical protein DTO169C6_1227 [Paecilomyces variotii]|nr:hypothetical protein DTO169C6_1227 [Paecilomyces variotii]
MDTRTTTGDNHPDERRVRELYRYFQPSNPAALNEGCEIYPDDLVTEATAAASVLVDSLGDRSSPNATLTSLAQLAALRLNAQRALISVVDRETQYFIAEATRSLNLRDPSKYENEEDVLWAGCSAVSRKGKLCETTIALPPSDRDQYSFYIVNDLNEDDAYKKLPLPAPSSPFRFYAGTPLTTTKKENIGTFFVLDTEPRNGLTDSEKSTMGTLATLVMDYLRVSRQASEGRRAARLSHGLACFVEGSSSLVNTPSTKTLKLPTPLTSAGTSRADSLCTNTPPLSSRGRGSSREGGAGRSRSGGAELERCSTVSEEKAETGSSDITLPEWLNGKGEAKIGPEEVHGNLWAFRRAANLLRESLEIGQEGGVIFLESSSSPWLDVDSGRDDYFAEAIAPAPVLAVSTNDEPFAPEPGSTASCEAANFSRRFLQQLLKRYPKGKIWSFHDDRTLFTSDDEKSHEDAPEDSQPSVKTTKAPEMKAREKKKWKSTETAMLNAYFPGANQILFVPLWNPASSQWFAGCFCWNKVETQVFSSAVELSSVMGFGSSIMAECSRVESLIADRQKGDFIGSISHELRSPLHGILAAAEFLDGTHLNDFQKSLLDTINACGRTLLDTMNQVLDFSKIVALEKSWRLMRRSKDTPREIKSSENISAYLDTYVATDVALLAEEVVEGVCLGHSYGRVSTAGDVALPGDRDSRSLSQLREASDRPGLQIILDVANGDWTYKTQPGALRRIIMNIFGNAMKYTDKGLITVRLESTVIGNTSPTTPTGSNKKEIVVVTVSDTGKGISDEFLRGRLYTPFAQEDTLAVGTGLGLSIVRSIVKTLGGSIHIRSRPGEGTTVRVSLPLGRPGVDDVVPETPRLQRSPKDMCVALRQLQESYKGRKVAIYGYNSESGHADTDRLTILARYVTDWFGLDLVSWPPNCPIDVLLADENVNVEDVKHQVPAYLPCVLILWSNTINYNKTTRDWSTLATFVDFIHRPTGPHKLSRALVRCLERSRAPLPISKTVQDQRSMLLENAGPTGLSPDDQPKTAGRSKSSDVSQRSQTSSPREGITSPAAPGVTDLSYPTSSGDSQRSLEIREGRFARRSLPTVPIIDTENPLAARPPAPSLSGRSSSVESNRATRVLVVDDNRINLRLMLTFMKKRDFAVLDAAENGKMAVDAVERMQEGYNIIFMDISMPVMNGFEATRAIRALERERDGCGPATIIALTGLTSARDETEALSSGVDLFLTKPISFKEVSRLLDEWQQKPRDGLLSPSSEEDKEHEKKS